MISVEKIAKCKIEILGKEARIKYSISIKYEGVSPQNQEYSTFNKLTSGIHAQLNYVIGMSTPHYQQDLRQE